MEINKQIQEATRQIDGAVKRIGEMEDNIANMERWIHWSQGYLNAAAWHTMCTVGQSGRFGRTLKAQ